MAPEVEADRAAYEPRDKPKGDLHELLDPVPLAAADDGAYEDGDYHSYEEDGKRPGDEPAYTLPLLCYSRPRRLGKAIDPYGFGFRRTRSAPACVGGASWFFGPL